MTRIMLPLLLLTLWQGFVPIVSAYATPKTAPITYSPLPPLNPDLLTITMPLLTSCKIEKPETLTLIPLVEQPRLLREKPVVSPAPEVASIEITQAPMPSIPEETLIASQAALPLASIVTPTPSAGASGGLNADVLFALVNQERTNAGLPAFEQHPEICALAQSRAPELENEIYGTSYMHAGFQARHLPFHATENMISQQTEQAAVAWWMHSPVHRSAILGSTKYACVACSGHACAMIFSNL
jgi:uncharacterized protein YkwD